ncbi:MAG: hypothetical protein K6E22_12785 [Treponema sp.]|nr:hypothetical protein [Treponema sp.]
MTVLEAMPRDIQDGVYYYCKNDECMDDAMLRALRTELFRWHDLRKNPDDLPEISKRVLCSFSELSFILYYNKSEDSWYDNSGDKGIIPDAWCEIPNFNTV